MPRRHLFWVTILVLPPALLGGCPAGAPETLGSSSVSRQAWSVGAGTYWVEYSKGKLAIYVLPAARGEPGEWRLFTTQKPAWYTGPALYRVFDDGAWARWVDGSEFTLDEVLQLHDPAPPAP